MEGWEQLKKLSKGICILSYFFKAAETIWQPILFVLVSCETITPLFAKKMKLMRFIPFFSRKACSTPVNYTS